MEQLFPNHKRSLSGSDTLPPRMEMGDSSNIGYGQFSEEVVGTSEIKSHSQEISSQTDSPEVPTSDYPIGENTSDLQGPAPDLELPEWENSSGEPRPVSGPLRRRFQEPRSISASHDYNLVHVSEDITGPPSFSDFSVDDFENDNISIPAYSAQLDELNYTRALNATLSNFVSVKLSGKSNYPMWRAQMQCLMKIYKMRGLVIEYRELPVNKKNIVLWHQYETLLSGWIIGSLSEQIMNDNRVYNSVKEIWDALEQSYDPYAISPTDSILLKPRKMKEKQGTGIELKLIKKLHNATLEGHWWKAKSILNDHKHKGAATWKLNVNCDTLLHVAVRLGNNYFLEKLLDVIPPEEIKTVNSKGHTALHIAAIVGNKEAAELLVKKNKELLLIKDKERNIPLACAKLKNHINVFVYLWRVAEKSDPEGSLSEGKEKENGKDGKENENEKDKRKEKENEKEERKEEGEENENEKEEEEENENEKEKGKEEGEENEIEKEREQKREGQDLLKSAIYNKQYDLAMELVDIKPHLAKRPSTLMDLTKNFPSQISFTETLMYPSLNDVRHKLVKRSFLLLHSLECFYARAGGTLWKMRRFKNRYYYSMFRELVISLLVPAAVLYLIYRLLCLLILLLRLPFSMFYFILWKVLAFLVVPIKNMEKRRKEHKEAKKLLKLICSQNSFFEDSSFDNFYKKSLMEAACLDVYEVLDQILKLSSNAMEVKNKDGHNILQLAVINRSAKVYNLLTPIIEGKRSYARVLDAFRNNLLHFAGRLASIDALSCISGAALQLQRELQWCEEVKKLMERTQHKELNVFSETPEMVFVREHANFVTEGEKWMKATAESCSITAALIITIVFAAAITVPGGSNQNTGIPLFKRKVAFNIFALADAISLFSASTSLLVFLSILTSRFAEKDFLISLPRRLFVGLCLLFLSTTAMMLAFSTILFLVFCDERPWMLAPIGGLTCFLIAAIVTLQLPLVIDLYQAISITIFDKENREEEEEYEEDEEEEKQKFQNIERDNNSILKRLSTACCLLLQEKKPIPKRSSTNFLCPSIREISKVIPHLIPKSSS